MSVVKRDDLIVPLDRGCQGGFGEVRTADEGNAVGPLYKGIRLEMEPFRLCLVHLQAQIALKVCEAAKCNRLRDVKIIANENTRLTATVEKVLKMCDNAPSAAIEKERYGNIARVCLVQV